MTRKIIFLVNPVSGVARKKSAIEKIDKAVKEKKLDHVFVPTNAAGNYEFLKHSVERDGITDIVIMGGDGTINQVTSALRGVKVNFGIIPMGSGNGLAYAAGIPRRPLQALHHVLNGKARPVDAFLINGCYSCVLSGLGLDANVARDFAGGETRGVITYVWQTMINYFKARPYAFEITIGKFSFVTEAFFISVANSNQFGNNFTIAPFALLSDGLLDVVVVQKMNKTKLLFAVLKQLKGNNKLHRAGDTIPRKTIVNFKTDELTIKNLSAAPLHIDGEPAKTNSEFNIRILRHCFELIQP